MKPDHRRSWWENEEFGRFKRWYRRSPAFRRRLKRNGHHVDRMAAKRAVEREVRWTGDENGWSE